MLVQGPKLIEQLRTLIAPGGSRSDLHELIDELQPYDLSVILQELGHGEQLRLLHMIPPEIAAETLGHFEPIEQYRYLDHLDHEAMVEILHHMSSDAVVQLFTAIHPRQMERLYNSLREPFKTRSRPDGLSRKYGGQHGDSRLYSRPALVDRCASPGSPCKVGARVELYNYIYVLGPRGELAGVLSCASLYFRLRRCPWTKL